MKISKKNILQGFAIFNDTYTEFNKKMQNEDKGKEIVQVWQEVFETINFDYEEANEDFLKAVKISVGKNKFVPTIAEIIEEMRQLKKERENKENQYVAVDLTNLTSEDYARLMRKEATIEKLIKEGKVHV